MQPCPVTRLRTFRLPSTSKADTAGGPGQPLTAPLPALPPQDYMCPRGLPQAGPTRRPGPARWVDLGAQQVLEPTLHPAPLQPSGGAPAGAQEGAAASLGSRGRSWKAPPPCPPAPLGPPRAPSAHGLPEAGLGQGPLPKVPSRARGW
ncbi:hypothetical protein VULLAG_LOCUS19697 [Vulpes lagopus]